MFFRQNDRFTGTRVVRPSATHPASSGHPAMRTGWLPPTLPGYAKDKRLPVRQPDDPPPQAPRRFCQFMHSPHLQAGIFPDSQPSGPKLFRIRETVATRCIPAIDNTLFLRAVMNTLYITTPRNETGLFQSFQTRAGQTKTGIRFTSRHASRVFHPARTIRAIQPDRNGKPVSIRANVRKNSAPGRFSTTHIIHFPGRTGHRAVHAPDLLPALTQTPE